MLYDRGVLAGTNLSWPISWPDVAADVAGVEAGRLRPGEVAALQRIRKRVAFEQVSGAVGLEAGLALGTELSELRSFAYTPRESVEAYAAASWLGERFAWKLSATVVDEAPDNQTVRPDGSYFGVALGNWMLSAGYLDRWWGPGWDGSLLLSSNARPVPAVSIERADSRPIDVPVIRWLGPWRFITFMGQLEGDRDYDHPLLFGMRIEVRPVPSLQIAASRTAQWCGEDRPCDLETFWDLIIGNDNDQDLDEQPGNQLAGFDVRWSWPGGRVPLALYAQGIGEDEAGFLPSKYLGLFGLEAWGEAGSGTWRAHVEYADTACDFLASEPEFGCAYTSSIYTDGYRYRGRALGHTMDADGQSLSFGGLYVTAAGSQWRLLLRDFELNRAGVAQGHSLAAVPTDVLDASVSFQRTFRWGTISAELGYADVSPVLDGATVEDGLRGFVAWKQGWR